MNQLNEKQKQIANNKIIQIESKIEQLQQTLKEENISQLKKNFITDNIKQLKVVKKQLERIQVKGL